MSSYHQTRENDQQKLTPLLYKFSKERYYYSKKMYDSFIKEGADKKLTCMRMIHNDAMFYKAIYDRNKDALMKLQKKYIELSHKALEEDNDGSCEIEIYDKNGKSIRTENLGTDAGYLLKCNEIKEDYDKREKLHNHMLKLDYWWI